MCLDCGFDGPELQPSSRSLTFVCPGCGSDLYARPPRSYAEMEGLAPSTSPSHTRWDRPARDAQEQSSPAPPVADAGGFGPLRWFALAACAAVVSSLAFAAAMFGALTR